MDSVANTFLRQLLLHRYKTLLDKLRITFALSEEQMRSLEEQLLTLDWISSAVN